MKRSFPFLLVAISTLASSCVHNPHIRWPSSTALEAPVSERKPVRMFVYGWSRDRKRVVPPTGLEHCVDEGTDLRYALGVATPGDKAKSGFMTLLTLGVCPLMSRVLLGPVNGTDQTTPYNLRYNRLTREVFGEFFDINDQSCCHPTEASFLKEFQDAPEDTAVVIKANTIVSPARMAYRPVFSERDGFVDVFRFKNLYLPLLGTHMKVFKKTDGKVKLNGQTLTVRTIENWAFQSPFGPYHSLEDSVPVPGRTPGNFKAFGSGIGPGDAEATYLVNLELFVRLARKNHTYDIFKVEEAKRNRATGMGDLFIRCKTERNAKGQVLIPWTPYVFIGNGFRWGDVRLPLTAPGEVSAKFDMYPGTYTVAVRLYDVMLQFPITISSDKQTDLNIKLSSKNGKLADESKEMLWKLEVDGKRFEYDPAKEPAEYPPLSPSFIYVPPAINP